MTVAGVVSAPESLYQQRMADPDSDAHGAAPPRPAVLYVCQTCPRYEAPPPEGVPRCGAALAARIKELAAEGALGDGVKVQVVNCLSGCSTPCNVTLGGVGRQRIRFSRMGPDDAQLVAEAARLYAAHPDGNVPRDDFPESLSLRLAWRSPAAGAAPAFAAAARATR